MDPQVQAMLSQIDQMMTGAGGALTATNAQAFNQQVAQFNANYGISQANTYGYNPGTTANGIQYPSPYAPTLAAQEQIGSVGYIPGYSGVGSAQTLAGLSQNEQLAQQNAANTGFYNNPIQSGYTPGTFVQIDPSTYDPKFGQQMDYVLPSGQLQRVDSNQAQKMGFNGNFSATIPFTQAAQLEFAPPQGTPVQTMANMQGYSNLNTAAENQALQSAGVTGMYSQPAQITAPGTAWDGTTFQKLPQGTQQAYFYSNGGDWNAAMNAWTRDYNNMLQQGGMKAPTAGTPQETLQAQQQFFNQGLQQAGLTGYVQTPGTPGSPNSTPTGQETMQAQQQMFNQANQLGTEYGQYYSPMMPGATAQPGINAPQVGQITEQGREFNTGTAVDLSKLASSLSGPADYFKYLQALNGGNTILSNLYNGQAQAPGGQVGSTGGTQSLDNILGQFGLSSGQLTGGKLPTGTYPSLQGQPGQSQASSLNLPAPNQIQPAAYNSMSPSAQQFVQGAYQSAGYNPQDLNWFMNAATPAATQSTPGVAGGGTQGTSTKFANPSTQSLFA